MNVFKLARTFPEASQEDLVSLQGQFRRLDTEEDGYLSESATIKAVTASERQPYDVVREALKEIELDSSRRVELEDYIRLVLKLREPAAGMKRLSISKTATPARSRGFSNAGQLASSAMAEAEAGQADRKIQIRSSISNTTHTIDEEERRAFTSHINAVLAGDVHIGDRVPFSTDSFEMFDECKDGLVLAKLINDSVPETIDERVLNIPGRKIRKLNAFQMTENNNLVIESAKGIGCSVVNIGSQDIIEVREHLILGLIWQIIRRGLLNKIDIKLHPELYRLLDEDETLEQFLRLPPEQILLRWFNYHLRNAKWHRTVSNFGSDLKDGENYTVLLNQLAPEYCSRDPLRTADLRQRAEQVLENADRIGCRKFLTPEALVAGNSKLNLAFVANLFNTHPGLDPITEEEKVAIDEFDAEGDREARVFTLWLNSLDIEPPVVSFFDDLANGIVLLRALAIVSPESVSTRHINLPRPDGSMFRQKQLENTNYAVDIGKHLGLSLVGTQGADITDGSRTLILGFVWQLMRMDIVRTISSLSSGGRQVSDSAMVDWANKMVAAGGQSSRIRSFRDSSISTGHFLLNVLRGMKSSYIDDDLIHPGHTDEEKYANAKLAISVARKLGATIWLLPDDIVAVRSRLVLSFIGSLMSTAQKMGV